MSDVFLSYKHEDEVWAGRLVRAFEAEGLSVWWDRGLPGGEEWRANIENALNAARCVVVLWSHASAGPDGGFVRDEATRARGRGILVPVRMSSTQPPLGFGEVQAVDLSHWRGGRGDAYFKDLLASVHAKLDGREAPAARGPAARLARRLAAGATATGMVAAIWGFGMNALGVQDQFCRMPLGQPGLADMCGAVGLGHTPTHAERTAWENRAPGDCAALRSFAGAPGHFQSVAADMLAAATRERADAFTPLPRQARNYVRTAQTPLASEAAARADAFVRANQDAAEVSCAPRDANERLDAVQVTPARYDCRPDPRGGYVCALDYIAECRISARVLVERCG